MVGFFSDRICSFKRLAAEGDSSLNSIFFGGIIKGDLLPLVDVVFHFLYLLVFDFICFNVNIAHGFGVSEFQLLESN